MPAKQGALRTTGRREHPNLGASEPHNLKKGEIPLRKHKLYPNILLCLTLLILTAATSLTAQELPPQGICLYREPAPPLAALNDGTGVVMFYWTIDYSTIFGKDYTLEIQPPTGSPFLLAAFPEQASPINNSALWEVPIGAPAGCYYARLMFFSDWCMNHPNKFEDEATVGFKIAPAARFRLLKFLDLNGNGFWDLDEPPLEGWSFTIQLPGSDKVYDLITGPDGFTDYVSVPVEATGVTYYEVTEDLPEGWVKTEPDGDTNPFTIGLVPGCNDDVFVGNWQPITITGTKFMDDVCWPWNECPEGCPGIQGIQMNLYNQFGELVDTTWTDENGNYSFPSATFGQDYLQWEPEFAIVEGPKEPTWLGFPYLQGEPAICDSHELAQWPGGFFATASDSPWQTPVTDFDTPTDIVMDALPPVVSYENFGDNDFFNRCPGRIFGFVCPVGLSFGAEEITVEHEGQPWDPAEVCQDCGFYEVPTTIEEPEGLRPGEWTLTPPAVLPVGKHWVAWEYYVDDNGEVQKKQLTFVNGSVTVGLHCGEDIRVDFCVETETNTTRRCFIPVTFTQAGWKAFSSQTDTVITGGMIYNRFPVAFKEFYFYSMTKVTNQMLVGKKGGNTIKFEATTSGTNSLVAFLPQTGAPGKLDRVYANPWNSTSAGALAGETVALQLNIAYNDRRLMPKTGGYDLENFTLKSSLLKGKTVGQVLDIANAVLGGELPVRYGFSSGTGYADLTSILAAINANYEFVGFDLSTDRGYLIPNSASPVGLSLPTTPAHYANRPYSP